METGNGNGDTYEVWGIWWYSLGMVTVGVFNVLALTYTLRTSSGRMSPDVDTHQYQRRLLSLSVPFVVVCAYRAFLPTIYLSRICFIDSWFSNILFARCVASVAEVCWVGQVALALSRINDDLEREYSWDSRSNVVACGTKFVTLACVLIVVTICAAEVFSFGGTLTTNSFWFMMEEGSWVVSVTFLMSPSVVYLVCKFLSLKKNCAIQRPQRLPSFKAAQNYIVVISLWCLFYVPWGLYADVPTNYRRWRSEISNGTAFLTIGEGIKDTGGHCVYSSEWEDWSGYLLWMTGYFSLGVWSSIALAYYAPRIDAANHMIRNGNTDPLI